METHADASLSADMPAASRPPIQLKAGSTAQVSVTFSLVHGTSGGSNMTNLKQRRTQFDALTAQTSTPPNTPAAHHGTMGATAYCETTLASELRGASKTVSTALAYATSSLVSCSY